MQPYDDPNFSYPAFWEGRRYEHEAELIALRTLLRGGHFNCAVDIGGGYGRLATFLSPYADSIVLVEPSALHRELAKRNVPANVRICAGLASNTGLPDSQYDLVTMVRVMHHIPDPKESIAEIYRILRPGGQMILEFANSTHIKAKFRRIIRLQKIPLEPVPVVSSRSPSVPFVNHHPATVYSGLSSQGFALEKILSVSNLRSKTVKKFIPNSILIKIEGISQGVLCIVHFGPSIFVLARKI